jgi:Tol biopolymer transport system component
VRRRRLTIAGVGVALLGGLLTGCGPRWRSELVSVNGSGSDSGNGYSTDPVFDPSGTKLAFQSLASDLGSTDSNENYDVYVRDLASGGTTLVSVNATGTDSGNHPSSAPEFSPDGTKVAFHSEASDLVPGDTDDAEDIFVRDLTTSTTTLITPAASGINGSRSPVFSPDGTRLVFVSDADNLVPNDANGWGDIFIYDLASATTNLVSLNAAGTTSADDVSGEPRFDPTGTKIAFFSRATDLTGIDDFNFTFDAFVRDLSLGTTTLLSINEDGAATGDGWSWPPMFNFDGTKVAFQSSASDLDVRDTNFADDVFVSDLATGTTEVISLDVSGTGSGAHESYGPEFSPTSDQVAFSSLASNLVASDGNNTRDAFIRDLGTGTTTLVSVDTTNSQSGNSESGSLDFSPDGNLIAFESFASNLVPQDSNGRRDLFVRDLSTNTTRLVSARADGKDSANDESSSPAWGRPAFDPRGGRLAFVSIASDLGSTDTNSSADVYLATLH